MTDPHKIAAGLTKAQMEEHESAAAVAQKALLYGGAVKSWYDAELGRMQFEHIPAHAIYIDEGAIMTPEKWDRVASLMEARDGE